MRRYHNYVRFLGQEKFKLLQYSYVATSRRMQVVIFLSKQELRDIIFYNKKSLLMFLHLSIYINLCVLCMHVNVCLHYVYKFCGAFLSVITY